VTWRARLFSLHRDLGYLAFGLTVIYAISGIAVNHRHDFDSDRYREERQVAVGSPVELLASLPQERRDAIQANLDAITREEEALLVARISSALQRPTPPKNAFWRGKDRLSLFFETGERDTVDYRPSTGTATALRLRDRFFFRDVNFLHLNEAKRAWTWISDAFALVLLFLAVSGLVMVKGKKGFVGRGGVLAALGIVVPVAAVLLYRYF